MKQKNVSTQLLSCSEVEIHYKRPLFQNMIHIKSSEDVDKTIKQFINPKRIDLKEFFWVVLLTNANRVLGISEIGAGTVKGVVSNFHEIFQLILLTNAVAFCVIHNHPSGNLKPSEKDKSITKKLQKIAKLFDVTFLDHLIITSEGYYSFSDNQCL